MLHGAIQSIREASRGRGTVHDRGKRGVRAAASRWARMYAARDHRRRARTRFMLPQCFTCCDCYVLRYYGIAREIDRFRVPYQAKATRAHARARTDGKKIWNAVQCNVQATDEKRWRVRGWLNNTRDYLPWGRVFSLQICPNRTVIDRIFSPSRAFDVLSPTPTQ